MFLFILKKNSYPIFTKHIGEDNWAITCLSLPFIDGSIVKKVKASFKFVGNLQLFNDLKVYHVI